MELEMLSKKKKFSEDALGATAVEYAIIVSLIAIATISATRYLGNMIGDHFNLIANEMRNTINSTTTT
jgi:pilus assembly protein Flp/PilA